MKKTPGLFIIFIAVLLTLFDCGARNLNRTGSANTFCYFLDVGEGSAALIHSPDLGVILIDTGNPSSHLVTKLAALGFNSVDAVILTHPHPDHTGGIHNVIELLSPKAIYDNGEKLPLSDPVQRWYHEAVRLDPRYALLKKGDRIKAGSSALEVLSPHSLNDDWNVNSIVILLTVGRVKILFMADGTFDTEGHILKTNQDISAQILQVGHHGSDHSSSKKFLKAVNPQFCVISVNKDNVNGYPSPITLDRLKSRCEKILSTSERGHIVFEIGPSAGSIRLINHERNF